MLDKALEGAYSFSKDANSAMESYNEYGFHLEKDLFDPAYCDLLVKEAATLSMAKNNNFKPYLMPHRENPVYFEALKHKGVVQVMGHLVGGTPVALQSQFFTCKPGTRGFSLHQDNFFSQAPVGKLVSVWVALVDTSAANGGMTVYPGSHKAGELPVRKLQLPIDVNQDPNANNEETVVPDEYKLHNLSIPKGSALFINSHLVHGSNANTSDHCRYALLNIYLKEGEPFRRGNYAQRDPITVTK